MPKSHHQSAGGDEDKEEEARRCEAARTVQRSCVCWKVRVRKCRHARMTRTRHRWHSRDNGRQPDHLLDGGDVWSEECDCRASIESFGGVVTSECVKPECTVAVGVRGEAGVET